MHYADIRPELDRDRYGRISPRVVHMHSSFGRRPRQQQMLREHIERLAIALVFGMFGAVACALIFWFGWTLAAITRHLLGG